jgi:hypothetical protein
VDGGDDNYRAVMIKTLRNVRNWQPSERFGCIAKRSSTMAKNLIGEPIPLVEPSPWDDDTQLKSDAPENPAATIESLRSDILPDERLLTAPSDTQADLPSPKSPESAGLFDVMQVSLQIALMPALAWTSYLSASCKAWENALQPQWPTR